MDARAVIESLRDGRATPQGVAWFAAGLADGSVSDAQAGAFAMAALLRGLPEETRVALTLAMRDSGDVLTWDLPGPVIDKHSTGGVGDSISLLLAPVLAECGAYVPMVSGRGLGHTGGTLDKLESIPGFTVDTSEERLRALITEVSFPNHMQELALLSGHLTPNMLRVELDKLERQPEQGIFIYGMKPLFVDAILEEMRPLEARGVRLLATLEQLEF